MKFAQENRFYRIASHLQFIAVCLFLSTLCLPREINQTFLIIAFFISIFMLNQGYTRRNLLSILILISPFLVALLSCLYTSKLPEAMFVIEKQLGLFLIPIIFGSSLKIFGNKVHILLLAYTLSIGFICFYLLIAFTKQYLNVRDIIDFQSFLNSQIHHGFSDPIDMHATYLSMYVCLAASISCVWVFRSTLYLKILSFFFLIVFGISLVLLSSRIIFVPLFAILLFVFPFILKKRQLLLYIVLLFFVTAVSYSYVSRSSAFIDRFKHDTLRELNVTQDNPWALDFSRVTTNDATRAERWMCAVELIKERPLIGYGTGDEKFRLREKYRQYGLTVSLSANFDAHNQYLAFMIKSGIFGLMTFCLVLFYSLFYAIKRGNYTHICFLIIVILTSLTENILESNKGILFFAAFNTIFFFSGIPDVLSLKSNSNEKTPTS